MLCVLLHADDEYLIKCHLPVHLSIGSHPQLPGAVPSSMILSVGSMFLESTFVLATSISNPTSLAARDSVHQAVSEHSQYYLQASRCRRHTPYLQPFSL